MVISSFLIKDTFVVTCKRPRYLLCLLLIWAGLFENQLMLTQD